MRVNKTDTFEKVSDEKISNIAGGNVSMIYKKGFWHYVWGPRGTLDSKFWFQQSAINRATELSKSSPGVTSGALKFLKQEEYEKKIEQGDIQKIV